MRPQRATSIAFFVVLLSFAGIGVAVAQEVRLEIVSVESPVLEGAPLETVGAYERIRGRFHGEVDPEDPANAVITDLTFAPRNARGMVEYTADFVLLKPVDTERSNGVLRYEAPNRGYILGPAEPVLLARGTSYLWGAWQGDVAPGPGKLLLEVPVATNPDGSVITGPVRAEFVGMPDGPVAEMPLQGNAFNIGQLPWLPADPEAGDAVLTRRVRGTDPRIPVRHEDWAFATCGPDNPFPGSPDATRVCLRGGFQPDQLYELIYQARDPRVMGLGLAAIRDMVAFFRHADSDAAGTANPLAGRIRHAIGGGVSQSGNLMKTFIHLGFNRDVAGRRVFDGLFALVAARQTNVNARFALPGGGGGVRADRRAFGQSSVRAFAPDYHDPLRGHTGGIFSRCAVTESCPRTFLGLSGSEMWALQGSPVLTDPWGFEDLEQPDNLRIYYFAGTQHGPGPTHWNPDRTVYPAGPRVDFVDLFRALQVRLVDWVVDGTAPPESRVPSVANGTLVWPESLKYPRISGLTFPVGGPPRPVPDFEYRARRTTLALLDFGPRFDEADESGIADLQPPADLGRDYAILVSAIDKDGNEVGGIRPIGNAVPLGTNLPYNYDARTEVEDLAGLSGTFLPFHETRAQRIAAGDERPSLEERYGTHQGYVDAVRVAAERLVADGFLLRADAERAVAEAEASEVLGGGSRSTGSLDLTVLSNDPDMLSGGDALVEVRIPEGVAVDDVRVDVDGRDVSAAFARRASGRVLGLVTGLAEGPNKLRVRLAPGAASTASQPEESTLVLTNHPIGGPIFSGPQVLPWRCDTEAEPSLGPPVDNQCNARTAFRFVYRSTSGEFAGLDPNAPLPTDIDSVTIGDGVRIPYIVRIERGTANRGIHEIATLFDPTRPWQPWEPQSQWNGRLLVWYGGGTSQRYAQGDVPSGLLNDDALRRGFAVVVSSMLANGQHANFVTAAETTMMLRELVVDHYGPLHYAIGIGGSGGALLQHLIADAYPGLLDGIIAFLDWEDSVSGAYREFADASLLARVFADAEDRYQAGDRAAITGWGTGADGVLRLDSSRLFDYNQPDDGTDCAGAASYDSDGRPSGIRCTFQDFLVPVLGRRAYPDAVGTAPETGGGGAPGPGVAPAIYDNTGVQYGVEALRDGRITAAQFVDLNARIGGWGVNGVWQPERYSMDTATARILHRTGQVVYGRWLGTVPEIALRTTNNADYHYPFRTYVNRSRLIDANGRAENHVFWIAPPPGQSPLGAMVRWLDAVEAAGGPVSRALSAASGGRSAAARRPYVRSTLASRVVANRPADVVSRCWIDGSPNADLAACDDAFPYFRNPRIVAGDAPPVRTMKCHLRPLRRSDYPVAFAEEEWATLEETFPTGVCDFGRPPVGFEPTVPWLTYRDGPGGQPFVRVEN